MSDRDDEGGVDQPPAPRRGWDRHELQKLNIDQLLELAAQAHIEGRSRMGKDELVDSLTRKPR